jgi:8-oxo-dGTP pyrophosphatase MutT (NUDIX family)
MLEKWSLQKIENKLHTRPFDVLMKEYIKPDQKTCFSASVLKCPNWANIIAMNDEDKILLIRQFRFGTDKIEIEIPGGVLESNEDPLIGAKRELEEETGYISDHWQQIGFVDANPAIMTNKCYSFLAKNIKTTGQTHFDEDEDIESFFATESEVQTLISEGKITNAYIIAAFFWLYHSQNIRLES